MTAEGQWLMAKRLLLCPTGAMVEHLRSSFRYHHPRRGVCDREDLCIDKKFDRTHSDSLFDLKTKNLLIRINGGKNE